VFGAGPSRGARARVKAALLNLSKASAQSGEYAINVDHARPIQKGEVAALGRHLVFTGG